jgi:hypothetical protein
VYEPDQRRHPQRRHKHRGSRVCLVYQPDQRRHPQQCHHHRGRGLRGMHGTLDNARTDGGFNRVSTGERTGSPSKRDR